MANILDYAMTFATISGRPAVRAFDYDIGAYPSHGCWIDPQTGMPFKLGMLPAAWRGIVACNPVRAEIRNKTVIDWASEPRAIVGRINLVRLVGSRPADDLGVRWVQNRLVPELFKEADKIIISHERGQ